MAGQAAPTKEQLREAGKRFREGDQAYKLGDYVTAIAAFEDAFRLSEDPIVLFNVAQAYRKQYGIDQNRGRLVKARDLYRTFMREVSDQNLRSQAQGLLSEVEKLLAETKDRPAATPPPLPPTAVPAEQPAAVSPEPDAEVAEVSDEAGPTPWYKNTWVWVAAGVVAAGAGAGVFLATSGGGDTEPFCPGGCPTAEVPTQ
jgi:tetratricopeptide (TPR) repeat protein